MRRETKKLFYGKVGIGGDSPISVQSMTNTDTRDIKSTINQIKRLEKEGCDLIRVAVLDNDAAIAIKDIKKGINIPIISDIHFDYRLALEAIKSGVDGLRINPGNIGDKKKVEEVVKACKERQVPIRIGVNSGSISKEVLEKFGGVNEDSMVYSAMEHVRILEELDYTNIKISLKATDVRLTVKAYEKISNMVNYPLHVGITEAGTPWSGTIKSSIGIGSLLLRGIGDTIRVSLTGDPVEEVKVGKQILRTLGILKDKIEIISCPTCGRTQIDLINLANRVEERLKDIYKPIKVAIMGCAVNGPGEAREADIGIAGGKGCGLIFKKGKIIKKVKEEDLLDELVREIDKL
ncbi:4-hydroxy-3-methylbut-2-en-1-yl diphosphate synthase IspG [Gottschalkia purinilytica]|uniref:4-hydroxy-3-methylbut-2-en-1-yl diphosphate synthase (flavodoxin) n=1 Tax=Gottschalkia purinilytica TaxID=1503 RepID=A0A0L0WBF0_GOTPU|nr:flavodoxin-dependent (E)-4-hydroxy-3-methylbut-2-enyl-diphosphate synthase [Gottschalkia purinilytica]KNF08854.1 4-hydroxy-3-methylbut-2-en-1-yl diphosphate synthase IspG [Gottschalkia purinilytica]